MLSKKVVKDIQSLGHKKFRDETNLFVAEGPKIVNELISGAGEHIEIIYATEEWKSPVPYDRVVRVDEGELQRLSFMKTPHQVLAVVRQFETVEPMSGKLTLYLDSIQDPGNFGTIIRIADWFGIADVVCSDGCTDLYNPKVVQSTMASISRVNVYYDDNLQWITRQTAIYAAALDGQNLYNMDKPAAGVIVIGNESRGVRDEILRMSTQKLTIPRKGRAESLNAAVATGIILSHLT